MNIINCAEIKNFSESLQQINNKLPSFIETEVITFEDSLGRRLAENIHSKNSYPEIEQAAIDGYMLNIENDIHSLDEFRQLESKANTLGRLVLGENPYVLKTQNKFIFPVNSFRKIGSIATTVISKEQYHPWLMLDMESTESTAKPTPIIKGAGLIEIGAHYKQGDLILNKEDIINNSKKALLRQAGIEKLTVYKGIKIAILYVDYELEYLNKNFELEYIKDCMSSWGYEYDVIKVKPNRNSTTEFDANISSEYNEFLVEIDRVTTEYDYVVACGLTYQSDFHNVGLNRLLGYSKLQELSKSLMNPVANSGGYSVGGFYLLLKSEPIGGSKTESVKVFNDDGRQVGNVAVLYEDVAIISFLRGYILDIIVNMHFHVKPNIYNRLYGKPCLPEWKLGCLVEDYEIAQNTNALWAQSFVISYNQYQKAIVHDMPQIKILNIKEPHPDQIDFMKDCNCLIPVWITSNKGNAKLKAGDYLYYLEI